MSGCIRGELTVVWVREVAWVRNCLGPVSPVPSSAWEWCSRHPLCSWWAPSWPWTRSSICAPTDLCCGCAWCLRNHDNSWVRRTWLPIIHGCAGRGYAICLQIRGCANWRSRRSGPGGSPPGEGEDLLDVHCITLEHQMALPMSYIYIFLGSSNIRLLLNPSQGQNSQGTLPALWRPWQHF